MKQMKKLLSVLLVLCMVFSLMCTALAVEGEDASMEGKIVILHSNDVHGSVEGYAKIAGLRDAYVEKGAEVILADCGDFTQGTPYVSVSKGETAIEMMNAAKYDVITLGNHEFDFGYDNLLKNLDKAEFDIICGNVMKDGKDILPGTKVIEKGGVKIGFVGLATPETYTKVNPALIEGVTFTQKDELCKTAQTLVDSLKDQADVIVCLSHLGIDDESKGNQSADVMSSVKDIDIMLDGHSHSVMTPGVAEIKTGVDKDGNDVIAKNPFSDLKIQSTGTKFAYIGVVVIDAATKTVESQELVPTADIAPNAEVLAKAQEIEKKIDDEYGAKFAKSDVDLNGEKGDETHPGNRTAETNMGDLICDAMLWYVLKECDIDVPEENVVALTNGGGIRAPIAKGDITMKDVNSVLPFGNTVAVVYVTGAELLEALEASCFSAPTAVGGFPQVSGLALSIATDKEFDQGDQYPGSTYYAPKSIQRVTIDGVNGLPFELDATYAVVTNNFCAAGGDTYYAFKAASKQFDTSFPMDEALISYIKDELGGVVGEQYAEPQGRIFLGTAEEIAQRDLDAEEALVEAFAAENKDACTPETYKAVEDAIAAYGKAENNEQRAKALDELKDAVRKLAFKDHSFKDVAKDAWYQPAVQFAGATNIMQGTEPNVFAPNVTMNRAMVATVLYRMSGEPDVKGVSCAFKDLTEDWYKNAVIWAADMGITNGKSETAFCPYDPITREQMAAMIIRCFLGGNLEELSADQKTQVRADLAKVYADAKDIHDYALLYVFDCYQAGLMTGDTGSFCPERTLSRAECAKVLLNYYELVRDLIVGEAPAETPAAVQALFSPAA